MLMSRRELEKKLDPITAELLNEKEFINLIDIFIDLG
jgi:hypothetical protein